MSDTGSGAGSCSVLGLSTIHRRKVALVRDKDKEVRPCARIGRARMLEARTPKKIIFAVPRAGR
jgi:hypothetical protein